MYSSNRMLTDYIQWGYLPVAKHSGALAENDWALCRELAAWQHNLPVRFGMIKLEEIIISGVHDNIMHCGEPITVRVHAYLGEMTPDEILAQLVIGPAYANGNFRNKPEVLRLRSKQLDDDEGTEFSATYVPTKNGQYSYGIRIMPMHKALASPTETGLVLWA
jgi:phosphorylase/glycogen(starch) synthase